MRRKVLRQCSCGLYNDITVVNCRCGMDISSFHQIIVDDDIPFEQRGEINETLQLYVKRCSECGALNFSADPMFPEKRCFNCHRARLARVTAELYVGEENDEHDETAKSDEVPINAFETQTVLDTPVPNWNGVLESIRNTSANPARIKDIRFTSVLAKYGDYSFVIPAIVAEYPVTLGREHQQKDFLKQDIRVGNRHCTIYIKNGKWYVTDCNAKNGTLLNGEDIGEGGTKPLSDGDLLKLGHEDDSIEFEVRFE